MVSKWMDKLRRGSGLDSYGNAYQFPYEKEAIKEIERLRAALESIDQWCRAYPRTVFIEPTDEQWAEANKVLDAAANCPSLTAISGSNMRHVVEGISTIAREALEQQEPDGEY